MDEDVDIDYLEDPEPPRPREIPRDVQRRIQEMARAGTAEKLAKSDMPTPQPAPVPAAPPAPILQLDMGATIFPLLTTPTAQGGAHLDKWHILIMGAGGVGARIAPLVVKHLSNGDRLTIMDGDRVEGKNLLRQHFVADDIGQYKAQVVADRAKLTAPRSGIAVGFVPLFLDDNNATDVITGLFYPHSETGMNLFGDLAHNVARSVMVITAVDTLKARNLLRHTMRSVWQAVGRDRYNEQNTPKSVLWIDAGNAMSSGQAMLSMFLSRGSFKGAVTGKPPRELYFDAGGVNELWHSILPDFLNRQDAPEVPGQQCALRIDTQSVLANMWAALGAATIAIPIISHAGIRTAGVGFSTSGQATSAPLSEKCITEPYQSAQFKWVSRKLA